MTKPFEHFEVKTVVVQTYYTEDELGVWLHRKIGNGEWEEIKTNYKTIPLKFL